MGGELGYGTGSVTDGILDVVALFGECFVIAFWLKDGVITKAFTSSALTDYLAFHDTLE